MITGLNHLGYCVNSIDETMKILGPAFGAVELGRDSYPELGQVSAIVQLGDFKLELMEPIGDKGVVPGFLAKNPKGGLHHVSLLSNDLVADCAKMTADGVKILGEVKPGALVFTHPKTTDGVIYEITDTTYEQAMAMRNK